MSDSPREQQDAGARDFREAFSHWRDKVHAEVRQASSLPTEMFDATDPMLEMRLAESTEEMLSLLHKPKPHITAAPEQAERRIEAVDPDEMRRLPARLAERDPAPVDLLADIGTEYMTILADACVSMPEPARSRAAAHMCADFGITAETLDATLEELLRLARQSSPAEAKEDVARVVGEVAALLGPHVIPGDGEGATP
jgi:hypothetical protein